MLEATLDAMETLGAERASIVAVLGPTIGPASYETGPEFLDRFIARDRAYAAFFVPSVREGHHMFDLPGFIGHRLLAAGVGRFETLGLDTYADEARFFSVSSYDASWRARLRPPRRGDQPVAAIGAPMGTSKRPKRSP